MVDDLGAICENLVCRMVDLTFTCINVTEEITYNTLWIRKILENFMSYDEFPPPPLPPQSNAFVVTLQHLLFSDVLKFE